MKKTAAKPKKTTRRVNQSSPTTHTVVFQRVIVIASSIVIAVCLFINRQEVSRAVAGTSVTQGLYMQSTVEMPTLPSAASYNIYYKQTGEATFTNSVRDISPKVPNYRISYLKKGVSYEYRFAAVDNTGKEFLFSETKPLTDLQSM
jgi:hypothetical protein